MNIYLLVKCLILSTDHFIKSSVVITSYVLYMSYNKLRKNVDDFVAYNFNEFLNHKVWLLLPN